MKTETKFAYETCNLCEEENVLCKVCIPHGKYFRGWHVCVSCDAKSDPATPKQTEIIFHDANRNPI